MSMSQISATAIALQNYVSNNFLNETAAFSWITLCHNLCCSICLLVFQLDSKEADSESLEDEPDFYTEAPMPG